MDQVSIAEQHYQQGLAYARQAEGEPRQNLQSAIACYELALQYYTAETFPEQRKQVQQSLATAYRELVHLRLRESQELRAYPRSFTTHQRLLSLPQLMLLILATIIILAIPTVVLARKYTANTSPSCVNGTLTIDGSTALQPLVEAAAKAYMGFCTGAIITVGGGASKTGLADVEQGHNVVANIDPQEDPGHIDGRDVPIEIGDSDIFASPSQHDLVDHQVAIGIFVMIVNKDVTHITNLTTPQIQGIYTGTYENWRQIQPDAPDLPIIPISRTLNSGTRFTFERYILKGVATVPGIGLDRTTSSGNAVEEVKINPGSVGYAPLHLASQTPDVTILSIDGRDPHDLSLTQKGIYHFWNIEHMYTRGQPGPLAQAFLNYMNSSDVASLITQFAFLHVNDIPQSIRNQHELEAE